ncbi:MAG: PIG-L family deacetylase [Clostridia bacterium]
MKLYKRDAEIYIYDEKQEEAFATTTHLAIAAHQDDVELMAYHGIAECFGQKDKKFSAIILTNGSGSPRSGIYKDYTDEEMMLQRKKEQKKAAFIGEYATLSLLMYPSNEVKDNKNNYVVEDIFNILMATKPQIVYTHNLADKHETHVATALRTISAINMMPKADRPSIVYGCEVWRDLDWINDDKKIRLDVGKKTNIAQALTGVFDSQISGGKQYATAVEGRRIANATFADDHAIDTLQKVTYAMDLTPLISDEHMSIIDFINDYINDFKSDVNNKILKLL